MGDFFGCLFGCIIGQFLVEKIKEYNTDEKVTDRLEKKWFDENLSTEQ